MRQERLVDRFVTRTYDEKVSKVDRSQISPLEVGSRVEKAKHEVESLRKRLLAHPAVEKANAEGKVVASKGLAKINRREEQYHAIQGPKGLTRSKELGLEAKSFLLGPKDLAKASNPTRYEGRATKLLREGETRRIERGAPSTVEALSIASLGVPGIGVGGSVAKLSELGVRALPILTSKEAVKQVASVLATKGAARVAATKSALKEIPQVLKASPQLAKAAAKGAPGAAKQAIKGAPKSVPRAVVRGVGATGSNAVRAQTGLSLLATSQGAGVDTAPGRVADAILEGTSAALFNKKNTLDTLETTARAIPAAVTAPAALLYGVGKIPTEGTGPLEETAEMQWQGLKQIGGNLLSGDPKRVQKAVQGEGALAFLAPLPALTRTRPYKALRTDVREAAAGVRRLSGKGRQAPKGVEQSVFGFTDSRAARQRVVKTHTRTTNPYRISEARHEKAVLHGTARRPALEKVPAEWGDTISTLLEAGIRNPEGVALMRERGPKTEPSATGKVNLDRALSIAERSPEMFQSKPFLRALRAAERASKTTPAALKGMGEVARYRTQGDVFGITPPDRAVPHDARPFTSAKDREGAWRDLEQMEGRLKSLKAKRQVKGPKGKNAPRRSAEIKALEKRAKGLRKGLDPYTRPGQKTAAGERKFWDKRLEKEYIGEVKAKQDKSPLVEPAWTHHASFANAKMGMEPGSLPGKAGSKVYVRRGSLAEADLVDRSLSAFVRGTIQMPRRRQGGADFARQFVRQEKVPYTLGGKAKDIVPDSETWARITGPKTKDNPEGGQFDSKTYARFPIREWKTAIEDPFTTEADLNGLLAEAEAGRVASHEPSVIVARESIREFRAIANPERGPVTEFMNTLGRTSSRLILGTNPSWVIAQVVAEGIPLLLAKPSLLNPVKTGSILKELAQFRKENPEKAAIIEGAAGASPEITAGSLRSPLDLEKQNTFNPQPAMFAEAAKELTKGKWGRALRSTAKLEPLGLFDIKRQNAYRSVLLAAQADKQFRGWTNGVRGMFRTSSKVSERFKGKSRQEMFDWLTSTKEGKRELQKLSDYVDNVQGNWTAFTRYERAFAPFVIFYPFLRYSLRWALWTFPKTHPLAATIAYTLGSANANELEKVLGAKPASPLSYSFPIVAHPRDEGEYQELIAKGIKPERADYLARRDQLPGGSRIAPGQSVIQQAIVGGKPSQLVGGLNPILGAGLTALGGPGPFGNQPDNAGWAAADQLLALPAPLRLADVRSEKVAAMLGLTRPQPKDVIAIAYEKLDPNKKLRQGLLPTASQSANEARLSNRLSRGLAEAEANSAAKRSDVKGDDSLTVQERQKIVARMKKRSDKAQADIDAVLKSLDLDEESKEAYERWKASEPSESKDEGAFGLGSFGEFGGTGDFGFGGDKGNAKALKYKPPGAAGIDLPNIGNPLGVLGNLLGAAVLGEKAQAATRPPKAKVPRIEGITHGDEAKEFAQYLAKYTGLDPQFVGAWVQSEGGGYAAGGEAGKNNWLGVGYPGEPTPFGRSSYFEGGPKKAAKATADWIKGTLKGVPGYEYAAADGIKAIIPRAAGKGPKAALEALEDSGWGTDVSAVAQNLGMIKAQGKVAPTRTVAAKGIPKKGRKYFVKVDGSEHLKFVPLLARQLIKLSKASGEPIQVNSGFRTRSEQEASYQDYLNGGNLAAVPGTSNHEFGLAADLELSDKQRSLLSKFGLGLPVPGEDWHVEITDPELRSKAGYDEPGSVSPSSFGGSVGGAGIPAFPVAGGGSVASGMPALTSQSEAKAKGRQKAGMTPIERLKLVKEITSGNLEGLGVPSGGGGVGPSAAELAALGESLTATRRRLLRR